MKTKFLIITLSFIIILCSGYKKPDKYVINAEKDAFLHNNIGLNYLHERIFYAAIEEFKIAINLSSNTQATAIYKNNLGKTYEKIGYPDLAKTCYEDALKMYGLNFKFYQDLAECYKKLNITESKIVLLTKSKNPLDKIMLGLLYIQIEKKQMGIVILDDFCTQEPDLIITPAIKQYLKEITKNNI